MSLEQLEESVLNLSREERRRFAHWFYEHESKLLESEIGGDVSEERRGEILRRAEELKADPGLAQPVDAEYFERMKCKVADALAGKTPAR